MVVYSENKYKFIKFRRSKDIDKKYDAILKNLETGGQKIISFGAKGYAQYKDSTGLKIYSHLDHLDEKRRERYQSRHKDEGNNERKYSAGWFSWHYLW